MTSQQCVTVKIYWSEVLCVVCMGISTLILFCLTSR